MLHLSAVQAAAVPPLAPCCILQAEIAGAFCESRGWTSQALWTVLAAGLRPPEPDRAEAQLGEWSHGWQYHASDSLEKHAWDELNRVLALPSTRRNAASAGKARLRKICIGLDGDSRDSLVFDNQELQIAVRRHLRIAVSFDGPDPHGHAVLASNLGARMNAHHTEVVASWRQVFSEAGGQVPDRNMERMFRNAHVPTHPADSRRLDIIVPGLGAA